MDEYTTFDKPFYRICPECGYLNERPDDQDELIICEICNTEFYENEGMKRNENNMNIDRTKYLKNEVNKDFLSMVRNLFDKEISDIKIGCKKQYTPNQLIQLHRQLYLRIAYNLELKEKYGENNE